MSDAAEKDPEPQEWFTTIEAAAYLRTSVEALRMRVMRGAIVPDAKGKRGRSRQHMFRRATLDAHYTGRWVI